MRSLLWALVIGAFGFWLGQRYAERRPAPVLAPDDHLMAAPTVLRAVQQLARLETVSYHLERVVDLKNRQSRLFGLLQADDAILLVAAGDVIAGVDLAAQGAVDVRVEPEMRRATITLPPPRILSARLDNQRTYVQHRTTDLLAERVEAIETRARQHAEREIRRAALEAGILEEAQQNARQTLETLLEGLGYRQIEVRFREQAE